ncbi:LysR family transcriptional regulator [Acidiphilium sp. AL]|uniref:LysR family transcriptional regulator n=1 Tax=Acidiphilium iwatense TaxID=768198 RepID=A0ABS9E293_9PROT|nr:MULTISPECIES: LysR family transcriptional regulator [Acidiphilium]MCF3948160.1 LysR family transcriptional regulator [Acidiphilium iwatense]MCU4161531.1 LysR family transcriptional regulator [Acidiphilium sp. AL]
MELTQVRYFVALSRTLNFTRAAEVCNVSQPALTRAIQRLEEELGGALLFRERNLTQMTELGRSMLPHLETMLNAAESAASLAEARRRQPPSTLKIGLGPGIAAGAIAFAIREVASILPDLAVRFEEAGPAALAEQMLADMLDCALLPADCELPERLNHWPLYEERAIVVVPSAHPLAGRQSITAADLLGETLLLGERCGGFAGRIGPESGLQFRLRRCGGSWAHLLDLVGAGLGVAILSERLAIPAPLIACRLGEPDMTRGIELAAVAGRPQGPAVSGFIKLCRARRGKAFGLS